MRAVADTGPLHYLILIDEIDVLPVLFDAVFIPEEVREKMSRPATPAPVRAWIAAPPSWLIVRPMPTDHDPTLARLDPGERAAITTAMTIHPDAVLMDDRIGVREARARGLVAIGTLGLLQRGARRGRLDLPRALARLTATNFHVRRELLDRLLAEDRARREER